MESAYVTYETARKIARTCATQGQDLNTVKENGGLLLKTGAKLIFDPYKREWRVTGYAWDGSDVAAILRQVIS